MPNLTGSDTEIERKGWDCGDLGLCDEPDDELLWFCCIFFEFEDK